MRYRYDEFPENKIPIYDFYIAGGRELRVRKYHRYEVETTAYGNKKNYRIHTGAGIVTKRQDQMDRVLAGHVFTLEYDPDKILEMMLERADADADKAAAMSESARAFKEAVKRAIRKDVVEEAYGTVREEKIKRAWMPVEKPQGPKTE